MDIGISDLKKITEVIKEKYNYDFSNYALSSFKRRILKIIEVKKTTPEGLMDKIRTNTISKDEFLSELTVNVTEMFRDPSFWRAMKSYLETTFKNKDKIKIWHAGCSSGEEVYSMLIMLHELGVLHKTSITASDIDKSILKKAMDGKIKNKSMELNKENYIRYKGTEEAGLAAYFKEEDDFSYFDKGLLKHINFKEVDLVKAVPFDKFDIVLCRNVLIYFNQALQNHVLRLINNSMYVGGCLAIGSKESIMLSDVSKSFVSINMEERIYKKNN